jgi:hypothetical protein
MTRLLVISGLVCLTGFVASSWAQEPDVAFSFDTDAVYGGAGHGTAEIDIYITGSQLTAIIRNTSPDAENYGSGSGLQSPAIIGWGLELESGGSPLVMTSWLTKGFKGTGVFKRIATWNEEYSQEGNLFSFSPTRDKHGFYNPEATGGLTNKPDRDRANFTGDSTGNIGAVFTAEFDGPINLVERMSMPFSPFVQFGFVGSAEAPQTVTTFAVTTFGTPIVTGGGGHTPEPSSLLIWALGIAICMRVNRRRRPR